jgi:hypothetical protein
MTACGPTRTSGNVRHRAALGDKQTSIGVRWRFATAVNPCCRLVAMGRKEPCVNPRNFGIGNDGAVRQWSLQS